MTGDDSARSRCWLAIGAILATGALLRSVASGGDLWLDEIWSLEHVRRAAGPLGVLLIAHDNSHPLNSLYLYALGDRAPQIAYRLLALASGLAAIALAGRIGARHGTAGALLASGAIALSFPMVVYSSEARGYMPVVALAFCAFLLVESLHAAPRWRTRIAFWGICVGGLLSHHVFVEMLAALVAWSVVRAWRRRTGAIAIAQTYLVPLVTLGALYAAVLSRLRVGGGPRLPLETILGQTVGWTFGIPVDWIGIAGSALLVLLVVSAEATTLQREGDDSWIFLVLVTLVIPLAAVVLRPPLLYPRYFLLNTAFLLLALAAQVARRLRRGGLAARLAMVVVVVFVAGNAVRDIRFLRDGRGDLRAALVWIAEQSAQRRVLLTSSNDFAVGREVGFHGRQLPAGKSIVYQPIRNLAHKGADWLVVRREPHDPEPDDVVEDPRGNRYTLRRRFPSYGPSGADWYVYARA